jgi:hypothetical protein
MCADFPRRLKYVSNRSNCHSPRPKHNRNNSVIKRLFSKNRATCQEMQNETAVRPLRCTARSHETGVPTGLGLSAFERGDGPIYSSSRVASVLPEKGGEMLAKYPSSRGRSSHPVSPAQSRSRSSHRDFIIPSRGPPSPRGQVGEPRLPHTKS